MLARSLLVLFAATAALAQTAQWTRVRPASGSEPPARQMGLMAAWPAQNSLVVFGGEDPDSGDSLNDVWQFDLTAETWTELTPVGSAIEPRFSFVGGVHDSANELIIFSGEDASGEIFNDAWSFDLISRVWTRLSDGGAPGAPEPRYGGAGGVVEIGGDAFLITSHGFDLKTRFKNSFALRLSDAVWQDITPDSGPIPTARCLVAGATLVNAAAPAEAQLAMFGGCGSGGYGPCPSSEAWLLSVSGLSGGSLGATAAWQGPGPTCLRARNYAAMAADGGYNGGSFFLYGGAPGVLVSSDPAGQLNSLSLDAAQPEALLWRQTVLGASDDNDGVPGQPSKNSQQSSMAAIGGAAYLQLGASAELWSANYNVAATLDGVAAEECNSDPIPAFRAAHGALMGIAWGLLIPLAVLIARFGRVRDPLWFKLHRGFNALGLLMGLAGLIIAFLMISAGNFLSGGHAFIGVGVMFFGLQQPVNAFFRPHKALPGEEGSKGRARWELWHKYTGRLALVLGMVNPISGLSMLVGTSSPGFAVYVAWFVVYVLVFAYLTARGLPYEANGPSTLAKLANERLCCFLAPWDDRFRRRDAGGDAEKGN